MAKTFSQLDPNLQLQVTNMINNLTGSSWIEQSTPGVLINTGSRSSSGMDFVEVNLMSLADMISKLLTTK